MKIAHLVFASLALLLTLSLSGCNSTTTAARKNTLWERELGAVAQTPESPEELQKELNLQVNLIPKGKYGRRIFREMSPQYITIHSTQNPTGDAYAHAKALNRGALRGGVCGYLCWHFTVQDDTIIQHIPTDERGEHADFDGPGNRYSIGIEMCEHQGNNQLQTMERTAKLAASLMYYHKIPIENIRAHYHWPREGYSTPNKDCPHFLLDNGRPGDDWRWFVGRINRHYQRIVAYEAHLQEQKRQEEAARKRHQMVQQFFHKIGEWVGFG